MLSSPSSNFKHFQHHDTLWRETLPGKKKEEKETDYSDLQTRLEGCQGLGNGSLHWRGRGERREEERKFEVSVLRLYIMHSLSQWDFSCIYQWFEWMTSPSSIPPSPFSPSLISIMVSVDIKHHVCLLTRMFICSCCNLLFNEALWLEWMCDECTWHHKTFLVQLYWHLAIKLYYDRYWSLKWIANAMSRGWGWGGA